MAETKVHAFEDCKNFFWRTPIEERKTTAVLTLVTCGACKQRLLKPLLDAHWPAGKLPSFVCQTLLWAHGQIVEESKEESPSPVQKVTTKARVGTRSRPRRKSKVPVKGRLRLACKACHEDPASPGFPGTDIRTYGKRGYVSRYCGGCGSADHLAKIRV